MDKHMFYYKVLEAIQEAKECPLCELEEDAQRAYLDTILYEAVNDPQTRSELVKSGGYCHRHAHYLTEMRDTLGVAIIYQDQVKLFMDLFAKKTGHDIKWRDQYNRNNLNCPACSNQMETRRHFLNVINEELRATEMKQAYESSAGFCLPHLACLLETVKDPGTQTYLYNIEQLKLNNLWNELQEFIRKHDYRYQDESYGNESDSWHKAIKKMKGNKEVF